MLRLYTSFKVPSLLFFGLLLSILPFPGVGAYNLLEECRALSSKLGEIHICLDNYLDVMDDNIADISAYMNRELTGPELVSFNSSQHAFLEYRRTNCLWYLEFSNPRSVAEQIAKNCLASMSQQRLSELQFLIATDSEPGTVMHGFYVYGENRNSFQQCGSAERRWVEGENTLISRLQQDYLAIATVDLQVLYVALQGVHGDDQSYPDHTGVVRITAVKELRVPKESDCGLPTNVPSSEPTPAVASSRLPAVTTNDSADGVADANTDDPEQVIRAYFGDWSAECTQNKKNYTCQLQVEFQADSAGSVANKLSEKNLPSLMLRHRSAKRITLQLTFPEREIDSPGKILWRVDGYTFGDIIGSNIRVDEVATRQLIHERKFIRDDLMPLLLKGEELGIEILDDYNDRVGDKYSATLLGLTRALSFANDFVSSSGEL